MNFINQLAQEALGVGAESRDVEAEVQNEIKADVRMFSGCKDEQTSADVKDVSKFGLPDACGAGGACTNAILLNLVDDQSDTWLSLLKGMRSTLSGKKFAQVPQLSTSRSLDINSPFSIVGGEGNKKSLLIGINYVGQSPGELAGCHNDVEQIKDFIATKGFPTDKQHCRVLMDDGESVAPTRANITQSFRWLTRDAAPGDSLFMHYSGHGGSTDDSSGDEADRKDETMIPVDYKEAGQIKDDEIIETLVKSLPEGVTLTVIMDCCHSGSIMDLPYTISGTDGTLQAVEAGEAPASTLFNSGFNFEKLKQAGLNALQNALG